LLEDLEAVVEFEKWDQNVSNNGRLYDQISHKVDTTNYYVSMTTIMIVTELSMYPAFGCY
jgi:hypothetical protein